MVEVDTKGEDRFYRHQTVRYESQLWLDHCGVDSGIYSVSS